MTDSTVNFSTLCEMLEAITRSKKGTMKRKHVRTFLDHVYKGGEYFSAIRLILPQLDRERGAYKLKEAQLAKCLTDALGLSKDSPDAHRLINWRKGGAKAGANAGNFPMVAAEVLHQRQRVMSGGLKIKDVNDLLDRLEAVESREEKTTVLQELISKTNTFEMKWILMIILKDMKLGMGEKSLFHQFHPDAEDMFNVTCDLKMVCEKLKDRNKRFKRQDIEVGKPVRPQLASRVPDIETAWKKLHGKQVVVECKFDGDRIQVHKNGREVHFFSRNFFDHKEYEAAMSSVILQNVQVDKCILDGEMLVWDKGSNRFADFGANQEIAKAARDGVETNQQLCYMAFDILYVGDSSVIHQGLHERHQLLYEIVKPLKGQLEILLPQDNLNSCLALGEHCWSFAAHNAEDVVKFFQETVENRDEGIILKDLDSKWEPGDRSGKWIKLKPDYINTGSDLDVLIIGGYYGSGRHGGEVAQFLLGLAQNSTHVGYPTRFLSFCRVGSGLSDEECSVLVSRLKPYFRRNEKNSKVPSFYTVTNNWKERPDVWIERPEKSVILEITSDVRMIKSEVFASPYSLRFPRIRRVRYDKPWNECLDVQTFLDLVQSSSGTIQKADHYTGLGQRKPKHIKGTSKGEKRMLTVVPSHMLMTDVSDVKRETLIFKNLLFYFVNFPPEYSLEFFHKMVVEHGGSLSLNFNDSVTHAIAADKKGIKYQAATKHGDVIHYSWVIDCCKQKSLLPLRAKYFLNLSDLTKEKMKEDIDDFGDHYLWDLDILDLKQLFSNLQDSKLMKTVAHAEDYKKKYCPSNKWCQFHNCSVYFHHIIHSTNADSQTVSELVLRRLKMEIIMHGGVVTSMLCDATHMIVFSAADHQVPFEIIIKSFSSAEKNILKKKRIHILSHLWVEDSLGNHMQLPESSYSLWPNMDSHESLQSNNMEDTTVDIQEDDAAWKNMQDYTERPENEDEPEKSPAEKRSKQRKLNLHKKSRKRPVRRCTTALKLNDTSSESNTSTENLGKHTSMEGKSPKIPVGSGQEEVDRQKSSFEEENLHQDDMNKKNKLMEMTTCSSRKGKKMQKRSGEKGSSHKNHKQENDSPVTDYTSKLENPKTTNKDGSKLLTENIADSVETMLADMLPGFNFKTDRASNPLPVLSSGPPEENDRIIAQGEGVAAQKKRKVSYKDLVEKLLDDK
ncbi:hypothetical protein SUGI_0501990 [Cryptomeria japonica]|uniref:DNA ligase 4 isoform X2 n=1 Tax=Cryptomeria japonica TaxID=3369 RepID=UPI002408D503|nr:DNA ligase 4 isoform X2 [Cryptomeria japonica]GLJ26170.1 hypothetical protein SUGI_0501990 [Cryptomeria japonica]